MKELIIYIIQANIALIFFAVLYRFILSRDTLFTIRRFFLLAVIAISFTFQFMPAVKTIDFKPAKQSDLIITTEMFSAPIVNVTLQQPDRFTKNEIITGLWLLGCVILTIRAGIGLFSILHMRAKGTKSVFNGTELILVAHEIVPFSFGKWIFLSTTQLNNNDVEDIMTHEKAHVRGLHSIDVLICEVMIILFWFNPAVWFIRYMIRENLEFLADRDVLDCGHNRKEYQYNLLRLSYQSPISNIANYFNVSQLKNRIMMMNREKTTRKGVLKYVLIVPALMLLTLTNNAQTREVKKNVVKEVHVKDSTLKVTTLTLTEDEPLWIVNGVESTKEKVYKMDPNTVKDLTILKDTASIKIYGAKAKNGVVVVNTLKEGEEKNKPSSTETSEVIVTGIYTRPIRSLNDFYQEDSKEIILIDGIETSKQDAKKIDPKRVKSVNILEPKTGEKIYGEKGKNGVVVLELLTEEERLNKEAKAATNLKAGGVSSLIKELNEEPGKELILWDGKEVTRKEIDNTNLNTIESVTILKNKAALDIYGEKGKNGVIIITSKK